MCQEENGISTSLTNIDNKIAMEKRLVNQFAALEKLLSQLNTQSQFLSQQLGSLSLSKGNMFGFVANFERR